MSGDSFGQGGAAPGPRGRRGRCYLGARLRKVRHRRQRQELPRQAENQRQTVYLMRMPDRRRHRRSDIASLLM